MKIDIFKTSVSDQRKDVFLKVNGDDTVNYRISLFWNKHSGYLMKGDDCLVNKPAHGFQSITYGNMFNNMMFGGDNKPYLVMAKGPGNMKYNKAKHHKLADMYLKGDNAAFNAVLNQTIKLYKDSGFKYDTAA